MRKYQILYKALSLRRLVMLNVVIAVVTLLSVLSSRVFATNGGAVTTADKTYTFDYKTHIPWVGANNSLFRASFNIPSPGTSTIDGDRYQGSLTFTKLPNNDYRLVNVIPYMDAPTFNITNSGGATAATGSYKWDESLQAWALPNPLTDNTGSSIDTSQAVNGSAGIKIYMTGASTGFMPLSTLTEDYTSLETRPVFLLGDVAGLAPNVVQNISFNLYQERAYNGDPNKWHAFNFNVPALVQYEYDGQVSGTNPEDQVDLVPGDMVHFESDVNLASPQKIAVDMIWQSSKDKGLTFNDIPETLTNSESNKNVTKSLDFVSDLADEGSLYRLKIIPVGSKNTDPIYTEPAVLTFKSESLTFKINYVLNGGTNHTANPLTYNYGQGISHFEAPQREDYTFIGWTDKDGNSITHIPADAQGEKTLHANWVEDKHPISYFLNGGENHEKNPTFYVYGRGIDSFEKATRVGYSFVEWIDEAGNPVTNIASDTQGEKKLYAKWQANTYKINYVLKGGENSEKNPDSYIYGQGISRFEKATRQGYTFMGWTNQEGKNIENISPDDQGDKTLYASWEKIAVVSTENKVSNSSDNSGGNGSENSQGNSSDSIQYPSKSESLRAAQEKSKLPQTGEAEKTNFYLLSSIAFIASFLLIARKKLFRK
ncbi:InlB B-repeat-containing protein [Lactococcus garvieae]|uniref:InlB B-repeat-containing protein n=1 Tax=Lactococcus garvieae TaxID=1363 RepID=UPI0009C19FA1|nr:InlB B-repeat-containing protein [Lactococcus garvieae]